ncbi:glycoside hydrolase family protein [Levilactobacillus fujinensis]|uniref:Uncharacterized protein n=1 Tax=Levilactobacillus fujinensis TaxID=2486024 RepID=A0ABW1TGI1_9LACO|nr:hypothetical protein [Levilactobacillus fujinensis]
MKLKRKAILIVSSLILIGVCAWLVWPKSTIEVTMLDQLGTQIQPKKVIEGRVGSRLSQKQLSITGYKIGFKPKKRFETKKRKVVVRYKPTANSKQLKREIANYHYIGASFQVLNKGLGRYKQNYKKLTSETDRLRILLSNDGIKWTRLAINYPNIAVRDPNITKVGNRWWIIYTEGLMWTSNFQKWHYVINPGFNLGSQFQRIWAPEIYRLKSGAYRVVSSNSIDGSTFQLYSYSFNSQTGELSDLQKIKVNGDFSNLIDPHVVYQHGVYKLWAKDEQRHRIVRATSIDGNVFKRTKSVTLPIQSGQTPEGPTELYRRKGNLLYFDLYNKHETFYGVQAVIFKNNRVVSKRYPLKADFMIRHFSVFEIR